MMKEEKTNLIIVLSVATDIEAITPYFFLNKYAQSVNCRILYKNTVNWK